MGAHLISNPVPTPEQMADLLGVSRKRVSALRDILGAPSPRDQIVFLTEALKRSKVEKKNRKNRLLMASRRRRLLGYVKRSDPDLYQHLKNELGLGR